MLIIGYCLFFSIEVSFLAICVYSNLLFEDHILNNEWPITISSYLIIHQVIKVCNAYPINSLQTHLSTVCNYTVQSPVLKRCDGITPYRMKGIDILTCVTDIRDGIGSQHLSGGIVPYSIHTYLILS